MKSPILLLALVLGLTAFTAPSIASAQAHRGEPSNDPALAFIETGGWPARWDCVVSLGVGYECHTQHDGFPCRRAGATFVADGIGVEVVTPSCRAIPCAARFTVIP